MNNVSMFADNETAFTSPDIAFQRAERFCSLNVKTVLELCVGPSLKILKEAYSKNGISVIGNDIDARWRSSCKQGTWVIGDAMSIAYDNVDVVVFTPPLSVGCSGKREDALLPDDVFPRYRDFIKRVDAEKRISLFTCVLLAISARTKLGRMQLHRLLTQMYSIQNVSNVSINYMLSGKRKILKYIDVDIFKETDSNAF